MTGYRIDASDDDVVRLDVNGLTIRIEGPTWRDANAAAHIIGKVLSGHVDTQALRLRLTGLHRSVEEIERAIQAATKVCEREMEWVREDQDHG